MDRAFVCLTKWLLHLQLVLRLFVLIPLIRQGSHPAHDYWLRGRGGRGGEVEMGVKEEIQGIESLRNSMRKVMKRERIERGGARLEGERTWLGGGEKKRDAYYKEKKQSDEGEKENGKRGSKQRWRRRRKRRDAECKVIKNMRWIKWRGGRIGKEAGGG